MEFHIIHASKHDGANNNTADGLKKNLAGRLGQVVRSSQMEHAGREHRLETPCVMVHTTRGCSPHMTWDSLERVKDACGGQGWAVQADVLHISDAQQAEVLRLYIQEGKRGRSFMGYPEDAILVATPRDPCVYEYIGAVKNSTDDGASIVTMGGATMLRPEEYMTLAGYVEADIIVGLGDEVVSDAKMSRVVASSKRTVAWMDRILQQRRVQGDETLKKRPLLVCPIVGGRDVKSRRDALEHIRPCIAASDGVYISGLGTGESFHERQDILRSIIDAVPAEKIRIASGISHPGDMLQAIACGVDMFDTSYVHMVTRAGYALHFPLSLHDLIQKNAEQHRRDDKTKLNIWSPELKRDASPLVEHCPCDTCQRHTRSYLHHLFVTHEMTGQVLLEHHNTLYIQEFLRHVRDAIRHDVFSDYLDAWKEYMMMA